MPLLRRRPQIQLYTPRVVIPGRAFVARVVLLCREAVPVEYIDVELRGASGQFRRGEYGTAEQTVVFMRQRCRVREAGRLEPGEHHHDVTFRLPVGAPAGYSGASYRIAYTYHVHVSVPWWPDARAEFVAFVDSAPADRSSPPATSVFASGPAEGGAPQFELSLGTTLVGPGEPLRGAIALANTHAHTYRDATLTLVALESTDSFLGRVSHRRQVCRWTLPAARFRGSEPLAFTLQLPDDLVAGFDYGGVGLAWYLHATVGVPWSRDPEVWLPLTVVGRREPSLVEERAPLAVGTRRVEALWRDVAARCGLVAEPGAMHGVIAGCHLRITREHREGTGPVAVARLSTPDLGLGLTRAASPPYLLARDMSQSTWLNDHVLKFITRCPAEASDHGLVFVVEDPGREAHPLRRFVEEVKVLAVVLGAARESAPAPAAMAEWVPAWERAAGRLEGRLHRACMAIDGRFDGVPIAVRTAWDDRGRPRRTIFEVRPGLPIDARHQLVWRVEDGPAPATELPLASLWPGASEVEIDAGAVRVSLAAPLADPLDSLDRIAALATLGQHLEGRRGHYR